MRLVRKRKKKKKESDIKVKSEKSGNIKESVTKTSRWLLQLITVMWTFVLDVTEALGKLSLQ